MSRPYRVLILPRAQRQLRNLPATVGSRVGPRIVALGTSPRPPDASKIQARDLWRIRIGDLRVIYLIDDRARTISIARVARRSESTYRRL
jgi:mRNA interferase RelE/StbE